MQLRERLRNDRAAKTTRATGLVTEQTAKDTVLAEVIKVKKVEIDNLAQVASQRLLPFLKIVNEEEFDGQGRLEVSKNGPFISNDGKECAQPYAEATLKRDFKSTSHRGYEDSNSGFTLRLRLYRAGAVKVMGANEYTVLSSVDLNDEKVEQQLEDAIFSAVRETHACEWHSGGRPDLSR